MKRIMLLGVALSAIVLCSSCHTIRYYPIEKELNETYRGTTYKQIVDSIGAPTRVMDDGGTGDILVYENEKAITAVSLTYPVYGGHSKTVTNGTITRNFMEFYVDENKVCTKVSSNCTKGVKEFSRGKTLKLVLPLAGGATILAIIVGVALSGGG
jgi:hypothetical protein